MDTLGNRIKERSHLLVNVDARGRWVCSLAVGAFLYPLVEQVRGGREPIKEALWQRLKRLPMPFPRPAKNGIPAKKCDDAGRGEVEGFCRVEQVLRQEPPIPQRQQEPYPSFAG